jgi:hypothetical protein
MQLYERLLLRGRRHPRQRINVLCHGSIDFFHHCQRLLLGLRTKVFFHVHLTQRFTQIVVDTFRAAFPSGLQLLLAAKSLSIKREVFIQEH